ncbi:MAG: hypothetical protein WAU59_06050 [Rhodoplanes sp.]
MAFAKKTFTPEQIKAARLLYENLQTPLDEVAASLKITRRTLEARIAEWGWPPRATSPQRNGGRARNESFGRRAKRTRTARKQPKSKARPRPDTTRRPVGSREALAVRVQRVVERELDAIDSILSVLGAADSTEAERSARTLASLARALKEVMRLAAPEQASEPDEDDPMPRDLDEFRRELARRIEALAAETEGQAPGDGG